MSIFKRISEYFRSPSSADNASYRVFVRCNNCGEPLKTRRDLDHDLSVDYDGPGGQSYFNKKTMVGDTGCFQRIDIELWFKQKRQLVNREISGGNFIEEEEYLAGEVSSS